MSANLINELSTVNQEMMAAKAEAQAASVAICRQIEEKLQAALHGATLKGAPQLAHDSYNEKSLTAWCVRGDDNSAELKIKYNGDAPRALILKPNGKLFIAWALQGDGYSYKSATDEELLPEDGEYFIQLLCSILPDCIEKARDAHKRYSGIKTLNEKTQQLLG